MDTCICLKWVLFSFLSGMYPRNLLKDGQETKAIDRRKEVYNFYEVEASLRYGIGKLWLDGSNIRQNKPYIFWNSSDLELPMKDK